MTKEKIAVLGGGSFGTVLANIAASNGSSVSLWVRDSENALRINSESSNSQYHPELELSSNIIASDDLKYVIANAQIILIAVPSIIFEDVIERIKSFVDKDAMIISCTKGIKSDPFRSMTDIIHSKIDFANENKVVATVLNFFSVDTYLSFKKLRIHSKKIFISFLVPIVTLK